MIFSIQIHNTKLHLIKMKILITNDEKVVASTSRSVNAKLFHDKRNFLQLVAQGRYILEVEALDIYMSLTFKTSNDKTH